jgi:hypothetical protein
MPTAERLGDGLRQPSDDVDREASGECVGVATGPQADPDTTRIDVRMVLEDE